MSRIYITRNFKSTSIFYKSSLCDYISSLFSMFNFKSYTKKIFCLLFCMFDFKIHAKKKAKMQKGGCPVRLQFDHETNQKIKSISPPTHKKKQENPKKCKKIQASSENRRKV